MPHGENLHHFGRLSHAIIEVVMHPAEMNAPYPRKFDVRHLRSDLRLGGNEFKGPLNLLAKRLRRLWAIDTPPR